MLQFQLGYQPQPLRTLQHANPATPAALAATIQLHMCRPDSAAKEFHPYCRSLDIRRLEFERQCILCEFLAPLMDHPQPGNIIVPQDHVIHVADISSNLQRFLRESIEPAQIEIREMLRGQAANGKAHP